MTAMTTQTAFSPRFPWLTADLQTIRNLLVKPKHDLSAWPARNLRFAMANGDIMSGSLHMPAETTAKPLAVLFHGLCGSEDSDYIRAAARHLLQAGYPVLRMNLRGAGRSRPECRAQYHTGRTDDWREIFAQLPAELTPHGLLLIGYSLSGNSLLKYLGEEGDTAIPHIRCAIAVSGSIDLYGAAMQIMRPRNALYHSFIMKRMIAEMLASPTGVLSPSEQEIIANTRCLIEFDDLVTAPRNGFADAHDFYEKCSSLPLLPAIRVPTLVIHALDDPWIPAKAYLDFNWAQNPAITTAFSAKGGHLGFHGHDKNLAWHDHTMLGWIGTFC